MAESLREYVDGLEPEERGIIAIDDTPNENVRNLLIDVRDYFEIAKENSKAQRRGWNDAVRRYNDLEYGLMADAKFHETPRSMRSHVYEITLADPDFITVHTLADVPGLLAAVEGRDAARKIVAEREEYDSDQTVGVLLGVTILSSHTDERCRVLFGMPIKEKVLQLAGLAVEAGLDGIVCAGPDLEFLQKDPDVFKLIKVVPGIVLPGQTKPSGQERVMTPEEAITEGADFIVMGSAVTKAESPVRAAELTIKGIERGLGRQWLSLSI